MSPRRVWALLREPRTVTALSGAGWVIVLGIGLAALANPPLTISYAIGPTLTYVWSGFLMLGGLAGSIGCLLLPAPWWRWVEQIGIYAALTGTAIYAVVVTMLHFTTDGSRLVQVGFILLAAISLLTRWVRISDTALRRRGADLHGDHS